MPRVQVNGVGQVFVATSAGVVNVEAGTRYRPGTRIGPMMGAMAADLGYGAAPTILATPAAQQKFKAQAMQPTVYAARAPESAYYPGALSVEPAEGQAWGAKPTTDQTITLRLETPDQEPIYLPTEPEQPAATPAAPAETNWVWIAIAALAAFVLLPKAR
jgi:hypothetical protein